MIQRGKNQKCTNHVKSKGPLKEMLKEIMKKPNFFQRKCNMHLEHLE